MNLSHQLKRRLERRHRGVDFTVRHGCGWVSAEAYVNGDLVWFGFMALPSKNDYDDLEAAFERFSSVFGGKE